MTTKKKINIIEIGPRDGLQNEPLNLETEKKIELISQLAGCGFGEIEATSFVHPKWIPNLADADTVVSASRDLPVKLFALVPNKRGYERAIQSGADGITFVLSATDSHSMKNLNQTTEDSIKEISMLVKQAKEEPLLYRASVSTAFGCPFEGITSLEAILRVVDKLANVGFERIGLCDTIGVADPDQTYRYMSKLVQEFPDSEFELHFHNTYGRGLANVYAGIEAGVYSYDSSIGGLGGCPYAPGATGNISTEDVVHMLHSMGYETGVDFNKLMTVSQLVSSYFDKPLDSQLWRKTYQGSTQIENV